MPALVKIDDDVHKLDRRNLLKSATAVLTGAVLSTSPLAAFAKGPAWSIDLFTLNKAQVTSLLAITRTICPHDKLDDLAYAAVVKAIDAEAAKDNHTQSLLTEGLTQLGQDFANSTEDTRVAALKQIETTPFFQKVHSVELVSLYNNHEVWKKLGYQGASYPIGGYIHHGFNDLAWLPDPPESASPKPA